MPPPAGRTHQPNHGHRKGPPDPTAPPSPGVTQGHRALDWLARRHDGESIALIAHRAGVTPDTVKAATATYGPFPRATAHLGRTIASDAALQQRARAWVHQRRAGRTVTDIARDAGVAHQHVSKATIDHGPFPAPDVVTAWVDARTPRTHHRRHRARMDRTPRDRAHRHRAVRALPHPRTTPADGVVGVKGIATAAGVTSPTATRWVTNGVTPEPDFVTARGRPLWLQHTVTRWLATTKTLATCPECGPDASASPTTPRPHPDPGSRPSDTADQ